MRRIPKQVEELVFPFAEHAISDPQKTAPMYNSGPVFSESNLACSASGKSQFFNLFRYKLLDALAGKNKGHPPVWLMRQAGRYMTSYQKLRQIHSFEQLALTPELAAEVTLLPIKEFDLDAAILFSDILFPLTIFGAKVEFKDGSPPKITRPASFSFPTDIKAYLEEELGAVYQAIRLLKAELDRPLIGFAGAPWTLFCYLISDGKPFLNPLQHQDFEKLFVYLEKLVYTHLLLQKEAGCDAVQLFDSLIDLIPQGQKASFLASSERIMHNLALPCIFYKVQKSTMSFYHNASCALSLDESITPHEARKKLPHTLQGNIDPILLTGEIKPLKIAAKRLLQSMQHDPGFIINVSGGLLPQTKEDNVKRLVDIVHTFGR